MKNVLFILSLAAGLLLLGASAELPANAAVTFTLTGQVEYFTVEPSSLAKDASANTTYAQLYTEQQNVVLTKKLTVFTDSNPLTSVDVAKNTTVDSFILHADQGTNHSTSYTGAITASNIILGVIYSSGDLQKTENGGTEASLGTPGETYDASGEGYNLSNGDSFSIDTATNTLTFDTTVTSQVDDLRIVTSNAPFLGPEPSSGTVLMTGILFLGAMMLVRSKRLFAFKG